MTDVPAQVLQQHLGLVGAGEGVLLVGEAPGEVPEEAGHPDEEDRRDRRGHEALDQGEPDPVMPPPHCSRPGFPIRVLRRSVRSQEISTSTRRRSGFTVPAASIAGA